MVEGASGSFLSMAPSTAHTPAEQRYVVSRIGHVFEVADHPLKDAEILEKYGALLDEFERVLEADPVLRCDLALALRNVAEANGACDL
jgi:hypothetical protein